MAMFGNRQSQMQPDVRGLPGQEQWGQPMPPAPMGMGYSAPTEPHVSKFNQPGGWADKLGSLGALFLTAGGSPAGPQAYAQINQRNEAQRAQQLTMQRQQAEMYAPREIAGNLVQMAPDGTFKTLYSAPKTINNDTANDAALFDQRLGAGKGDEYLRSKLDPIVNIPLPGGRVYVGPKSMLGKFVGGAASGGSAPPATLPPDFDFNQSGPAPGTMPIGAPHMMTRAQAAQMQAALGSGFEAWRQKHGIQVVDQ